MAESEEGLKSLLMKVKEESKKVSLKFNIQKTKIMASGPITSWQIDGETVETVRDFIFLGSKITANGDCSHEIQRRLLLGRKAMTNLDRILKSRDITLPTKVHLVKAMVFPVVMYGCESQTIKKAEHQRIDAFWTVALEKTLESPLDCKDIKPVNPKGNQSWIFIRSTEVETDGPILWPSDTKTQFTEEDPDAGKDWRQEEKGTTDHKMVEWHHQLSEHEFQQTPGKSEGQGSLACCSLWGRRVQTGLSNWTTCVQRHICHFAARQRSAQHCKSAVLGSVAKLRLTLSDPLDCSPPGSSFHEILQARTLEWVTIPSSVPTQGLDLNLMRLLHW